MAHVAPWKFSEVAKLAKMLTDQPVVGVAKIGGIPGPQMAEMRASLRDHVTMIGTKNRLLKLAIIEAAKTRPTIAELTDLVDGQIAVIATDMNPFKLYKQLEAGATMAPVSGGSIAPCDLIVQKGPTSFGPGPIVGEFQKVGIPAKIEGPKVAITKTTTVVKEGEVVSQAMALMLSKLGIKPVQLKINLRAAVEENTLFTPDVLAVDETKVLADLMLAVRIGHELSLQTAFPTKQSMDALVGRAYRMAVAVALESGVDLGAAADTAAEAYAKVLAGIGKKPEDLSDALKERLGSHVEILSNVAVAPAPVEAPVEEEEEEDEGVSEDEAAAGLGALFG
jgi:large subunit ribosomal protein L10